MILSRKVILLFVRDVEAVLVAKDENNGLQFVKFSRTRVITISQSHSQCVRIYFSIFFLPTNKQYHASGSFSVGTESIFRPL